MRLAELRHGFYRYISLRSIPYMLVALIAAASVLITWIIAPDVLQGASIVGVVLGVISVGTGIVRSVTDEVTKAIPQLVEEPDYTSRLGFLHLVDSDMHRILRAAGATPREPFVIFIDDLDRCTYGTVAQVIEALNVFLAGDFDNCIFVIAMEPDLVAAQIHIAYRELFDRLGEDGGGDLGWRFLEKMVQLPLALPEPRLPQVERFVDSILIVETEARIADVADNALEIENQREAISKVQTTKTPEGVAEAMEQVRDADRAKGIATAESDAALRKAARLEFRRATWRAARPDSGHEDGAFMECHEEGPPRRRHSPVTTPIGKEARGEVCRTRLGISNGAVVRTGSRPEDRRRGPDRC